MTTIDIEFEWTRGHRYEVGPSANDKAVQVIRQTSSGRDRFNPLEIPTKLYLAFSELDGSPEACVAFAKSWGLLTLPARNDAAERLDAWRAEIKKMKSRINAVGFVRTANSRRIRMPMTSLEVALVSGEPNKPPALVMLPRTLLEAMYLQLAQSHASGADLATCAQCGKWFEIGAGGARRGARFCSDTCRRRHHYEQSTRSAGKS